MNLHPAKTCIKAATIKPPAYPPASSSYSMLCFVGARRSACEECRKRRTRYDGLEAAGEVQSLIADWHGLVLQLDGSDQSLDNRLSPALRAEMHACNLAIFTHAFSNTQVETLLCGTRNRTLTTCSVREPWRSKGEKREPLMADQVLRMLSHWHDQRFVVS